MSCSPPTSTAELQQLLSERYGKRQPTHLASLVRTSCKEDSLQLSSLNQVIDYPFRDMTITVQSGITIAALQQILGEYRQWLPVDVPLPEQMTVAELILHHWYGSLSAGYGTIRDWLLGVAAVDGQGRLFHAGGRVVKNVAGYDLCKLLVGSGGELAIPAEVTLQVRPLPETIAVQTYRAASLDELQSAWVTLRDLPMKPVLLDLDNVNFHLTLAVEGTAPVTRQLLSEATRAVCQTTRIDVGLTSQSAADYTCWKTLSLCTADEVSSRLLMRAGVLPSQVIPVLEAAARNGWKACGLSARGTVYLTQAREEFHAETWEQFWQSLLPLNPGLQVLWGIEQLLRTASLRQQQQSAWPLMQQLKGEFDPANLLQSTPVTPQP